MKPFNLSRLICPGTGAVRTPYRSHWNSDSYGRREAFAEHPFEIETSSTSGACVAVSESGMVGALSPVPVKIGWSGKELLIEGPENGIWRFEGSEENAWEAYHETLGLPPAPEAIHDRLPEYCTWVEQGWTARQARGKAHEVLTSGFVRRYLDEVTRDEWPRGRFTIDEGWCPRHGEGGFGDWWPRPGMDMSALSDEIRAAGHVPGLWLAAGLVSESSHLARKHPELVGGSWEVEAESSWSGFRFLRPCDAARAHLAGLFRRAWDWGFRKLKLDIFYGPKQLMIDLHRLCREAAAMLPGLMELEGHVPDPFAAQWVHVVRLNDVLISPGHPGWRKVVAAHFRVCRESAPGHLLNLDHLGGNSPDITEDQWVEHAAMQRGQLQWGHPVISLLPEHLGARAVEAATELLNSTPLLSPAAVA